MRGLGLSLLMAIFYMAGCENRFSNEREATVVYPKSSHSLSRSDEGSADQGVDLVTDAGGSMGQSKAEGPTYEVVIRKPQGPPRIELAMAYAPELSPATSSPHPTTTSVACSTCHSLRQPDRTTRSTQELDQFHRGLVFAHGTLACLACHHPKDYDQLTLADQTSVPFSEVMDVCAQCHAMQMRDYRHGVHGGMNGYWDLSRGGRQRLNCIDCHDPHQPKYPMMRPTFHPKDRFSENQEARHD